MLKLQRGPVYRSPKKVHNVETLEARCLLAGDTVLISEILAVNDSVSTDEDEEFSDWVEIFNPGQEPVGLSGWTLSDDLDNRDKWTFPEVSIPSNQYLVIYASSKDRRDPAGALHTNFRLDGVGEYISISNPEGELISGFSFPQQRPDQSFGFGVEASDKPTFLANATPGEPNGVEAVDVISVVGFSHEHGFYEEPFSLELTGSANTTIRYSLDGSAPSATEGKVYDEPITVSGNRVVRAVQYKPEGTTSRIATNTYIFLDDVIGQSTDSGKVAGFPDFDFEMDPEVIGQNDIFGGKYRATIRDDLLSIPTMALSMNVDDLFGTSGIYSNPLDRGPDSERPTSIELFYPDGESGFQVDAGIRIQGGVSREITDKKSFRVQFKRQYGPTRLKYPLFGDAAPDEFDSITLRSSGGEHLVGIHYLRDTFVRDSQIATGQPGSHSTWVHLYINGLYWGIYNPSERVDDAFAATYAGGEKVEYDVIQQSGVSTGTDSAWRDLNSLAREMQQESDQTKKSELFWRLQGRNLDGSPNPEYPNLLDVDNFIDYMIVQTYAGNRDWLLDNFVIARRQGDESKGFQFYVWDAEWVMDQGGLPILGELTQGVAEPMSGLLTSEAFLVRMSDRIHKHFSPGGTFYVNSESPDWDPAHPENNVPASRYAKLVEQLRSPLVAETARWGDERAHGDQLFTRDEVWQSKVDQLFDKYFPNHSRQFFHDNGRFYRMPPSFTTPGGLVANGSSVEISAAAPIYYTIDGTDPMMPDGSVSTSATRYEVGIPIESKTTIMARSLDGDKWSSFDSEAYSTLHQLPNRVNLRITEVNYHPHDALPEFGERNENDSRFEFIEITNVSPQPIDLAGVSFLRNFREGVSFTFGEQVVEPGQSIVIPRDRTSFVSRYGADIVLARGAGPFVSDWEYSGSLSDSGDRVLMVVADGKTLHDFSYLDGRAWPGRADGIGSSLKVLDVHSDYNDPNNWRSSSEFGGSPGTTGIGPDRRVVVNEVFFDETALGSGKLELYNATDQEIDVSHWLLSDDDDDFLKYRFPEETVIPSGGYLTMTEEELGFRFDNEDVWLLESSVDAPPSRFVDHVEFSFRINNTSMGRWPNVDGPLTPMTLMTFGTDNSRPNGDFDIDGVISGNDLDLLCQAVDEESPAVFDVDDDGSVSHDDLDFLLHQQLQTNYGDVNLDGVFNSEDLVMIFQTAQYNDQITGNSKWATGDWTCDKEFDSSDLVKAFQSGAYDADVSRTRSRLEESAIAAALVFLNWDQRL